MKRNMILITLSITLGVLFTFFVLNKKDTYAMEEYLIYAFQVGAFEKEENALEYAKNLESSLVSKENNLYKVYVALYKDIDIVNKMLVYFENNNINIYLKSVSVSKEFYYSLDSYEKLLKESNNQSIYKKINQSILNDYLESMK